MMTNDTYHAMDAGLHNSAMQIESPWRRMSRVIPIYPTPQAYINSGPPSIEYDLKGKVS